MNVKVLIDNIVRQTTVLIAELATAAGVRAPLAHVANEVFLDLVRELEAQGVGRKVIADMFGIALRSYQVKVQRLSESQTQRDRSLWEAVLEQLRSLGVATRAELLGHFSHDDPATLGGILHDLVESGLAFRSGRGARMVYRAADEDELSQIVGSKDEGIDELVWIAIYRLGPIARADLRTTIHLDEALLDEALGRLVSSGVVTAVTRGDETRYDCDNCIIPLDSEVGWEAALFDHFQSIVNAIAIKLREGKAKPHLAEVLGGSTYSFDVWPEHPLQGQVLSLLGQTRRQISALRTQVTAFNEENGKPESGFERVTFYFGQSVRPETNRSVENGDEDGA